jgi:hypothetical protein
LVNVCSACFVQSTVLIFPWQIYVAWRFFFFIFWLLQVHSNIWN